MRLEGGLLGGRRWFISTENSGLLICVFGMRFRTCEKNLDSAESQNLVKNNCAKHPKTRPLRGAKNRIQASSSASADFLLEAEKRGSPPKSEKAAAFWEHNLKKLGRAGRGVQPFCEKEKIVMQVQNLP